MKICLKDKVIEIDEKNLKGIKDDPGPRGDSYEDCLRKYWPEEYKKWKEEHRI